MGIRKTVGQYFDHQEWVANVQSGAYRNWVEKIHSKNHMGCKSFSNVEELEKLAQLLCQKRLQVIPATSAKIGNSDMNVLPTAIPDVFIIEPKVFGDERGLFFESFNRRQFSELIGRNVDFVQDNHSRSAKNVLRGLHYQIQQPQGKLMRVVQGTVFDVAVDIRRSSPTFGQHVAVELSAENKRMLWIPEGFAHGFVAVSDTAEFLYKTTDYWAPKFERSIAWNDPTIGIQWLIQGEPSLSAKDRQATALAEAEHFA